MFFELIYIYTVITFARMVLDHCEIGRMRHIDVAYLWLQNEVECEDHFADFGTKALRR